MKVYKRHNVMGILHAGAVGAVSYATTLYQLQTNQISVIT